MATLKVTFSLDELEERLVDAMDAAGDGETVVIDVTTAVMAASLVSAYREAVTDNDVATAAALRAHIRQEDTGAGRVGGGHAGWQGGQ